MPDTDIVITDHWRQEHVVRVVTYEDSLEVIDRKLLKLVGTIVKERAAKAQKVQQSRRDAKIEAHLREAARIREASEICRLEAARRRSMP
jgi:hypothetical protein